MTYQPIRREGQNTNDEYDRVCEDRYQILKRKVFSRFKRSFSLFDFGAYAGYFGIRAGEDSLPVNYIGVDQNTLLPLCLADNAFPGHVALNYQFKVLDLLNLSYCEDFDVVLALSVLHWFPYWQVALDALLNLGQYVVVEIPNRHDKAACGQAVISQIDDYIQRHCNPTLLAEVACHTSAFKRPIYLLEGKNRIIKSYVDKPRVIAHTKTVICATDTEKTIQIENRPARKFVSGLNLRTYQAFGGVYPTKEIIERRIRNTLPAGHYDFRPWNIILTNDTVYHFDGVYPDSTAVMEVEQVIASLYGKGKYAYEI